MWEFKLKLIDWLFLGLGVELVLLPVITGSWPTSIIQENALSSFSTYSCKTCRCWVGKKAKISLSGLSRKVAPPFAIPAMIMWPQFSCPFSDSSRTHGVKYWALASNCAKTLLKTAAPHSLEVTLSAVDEEGGGDSSWAWINFLFNFGPEWSRYIFINPVWSS